MFSKILSAMVLFASLSAHAAGGESEFFFQSKAGQSDLTPRLGYRTATTKGKGAGATEVKVSGLVDTGLSYEYGINEMFALEGSLLFTSAESDQTPKRKISGLQDPTLKLKGTSNMGSSRLRYGIEAGLSFEKAKVKTNGDMSAATGGFSFTPYIGMDADVGGGIVGGRLNYAYLLERTVDAEALGKDVKLKDGNKLGLSAFYEMLMADVLLGGSINYTNEDAVKAEGNELTKSNNTLGISLYSRIPFGTMDLLPRIDYDFSNSELDKYDVLTFSVAARFGF